MVKYFNIVLVGVLLVIGAFYEGFSLDKSSGYNYIYYDNVSYTNNVTLNSMDGINLDYSAELNNPGDYYEIYFDVVNDTNYDFSVSNLSLNNDDKYIHYELSYSDGYSVRNGDIIKKGERKKLVYKVLYKSIVLEQYNINTDFTLDFEQL